MHHFQISQAEYEREQIDWSYIEFVDNQDVLDLIEGKMGVLDLLDEQCRFPTSTNKVWHVRLEKCICCWLFKVLRWRVSALDACQK